MNIAGFNGELVMSPVINQQGKQVVQANAEMVGATAEMVQFYKKQDWGLLQTDRGSRRIIRRALEHAKRNPDITTVIWVAGEGGGNGKTARAATILAKLGFDEGMNEEFIERSNGWELQARYIGMTTVGQDLQKRHDSSGKQLVDKTAPNWTAEHLLRIRNQFEATVAIAGSTTRLQEMNKEKYPDKKIATVLVVEDLTGFAGNRPFRVADNHHGIWVQTNPEAQANASPQRARNEEGVELGQLYQENGGVAIDKPSLVGTDALDFMGNDASRIRAVDRMNRLLMSDEVRDILISRGTQEYNYSDLNDNPYFRNEVVLPRFYQMRVARMGFRKSNVAVVENPFVPGLAYNLNLIREMKVDSNAIMGYSPKGSL